MKILLVRLDHAGAVVLTVVPVVQQLRSDLPDVRNEVLTMWNGESLLRGDPAIDRIIAWDAPQSVRLPPSMRVPGMNGSARVSNFVTLLTARRFACSSFILSLSFSPGERLLSWQHRRQEMGERHRKRAVASFSQERFAVDMLEVYTDVARAVAA